MAPKRTPAQIRTIDAASQQIRVTHRQSGEVFKVQLIGGGRQKVRLEGPHEYEFEVEARDQVTDFLPKPPPLPPA